MSTLCTKDSCSNASLSARPTAWWLLSPEAGPAMESAARWGHDMCAGGPGQAGNERCGHGPASQRRSVGRPLRRPLCTAPLGVPPAHTQCSEGPWIGSKHCRRAAPTRVDGAVEAHNDPGCARAVDALQVALHKPARMVPGMRCCNKWRCGARHPAAAQARCKPCLARAGMAGATSECRGWNEPRSASRGVHLMQCSAVWAARRQRPAAHHHCGVPSSKGTSVLSCTKCTGP